MDLSVEAGAMTGSRGLGGDLFGHVGRGAVDPSENGDDALSVDESGQASGSFVPRCFGPDGEKSEPSALIAAGGICLVDCHLGCAPEVAAFGVFGIVWSEPGNGDSHRCTVRGSRLVCWPVVFHLLVA